MDIQIPSCLVLNIPGPTTIYFPAYVGATGMNFHLTVDVTSTGDLSGHVTNYYGLAISGATVSVTDLGLTTVSDPSGYYQFLDIAAGTHTVSCIKTGFNPNTASVYHGTGCTDYSRFCHDSAEYGDQSALY